LVCSLKKLPGLSGPYPAVLSTRPDVVDLSARRGSGIVALDLSRGKRLWHTDASEPLLATGDRLFALNPIDTELATSEVQVVVLNAGDGSPALACEPVTLPDALPQGAVDGANHPFCAKVSGDVLTLSWHAKGRYDGGAAAPPELRSSFAKKIQGHAKISLTTGKAAPAVVGPAPSADPAPAPDFSERLKAMKPAPFWSGSIENGPFAALVLDTSGGKGQSLILTTWDRGARNDDAGHKTVLAGGKSIAPIVTSDGRHVLIQIDPPSEPSADRQTSWTVIDLATGATLGKAPLLAPDDQDPTIRVGRLFTVAVPPAAAGEIPGHTLRAKDLKSGKLLWTHAVRWPQPQPPRPGARRR
jgi:hypothetical protein